MAADLRDSDVPGETAPGATAVDVCICTFRRPSLEATLRSVARQALPTGVRIRVVVADNDETPTARALATRVADEVGLDLSYVHAPARNISIARNACLEAARAPLVAFIDDDEEAEPDWLARLIGGVQAADVVFGPVRAIYGEETPGWVRRADLHSIRPVVRDGQLDTGYSCNVLLRRDCVGAVRFDPALGRSGGEDTWFFRQLARQGARLAYQADAVTTEIVPPARARLDWLLRRSFRAGQTHARMVRAEGGGRLSLAAQAAAKAAYCAGSAALSALSPDRRSRALVRGALHVGVLGKLFGKSDLVLY